jgi:hypothetical protein
MRKDADHTVQACKAVSIERDLPGAPHELTAAQGGGMKQGSPKGKLKASGSNTRDRREEGKGETGSSAWQQFLQRQADAARSKLNRRLQSVDRSSLTPGPGHEGQQQHIISHSRSHKASMPHKSESDKDKVLEMTPTADVARREWHVSFCLCNQPFTLPPPLFLCVCVELNELNGVRTSFVRVGFPVLLTNGSSLVCAHTHLRFCCRCSAW